MAAVGVLGAVVGWIIGLAVWFFVQGPTESCVNYSRNRDVCSSNSGMWLAILCGIVIGAAAGVIVMTLWLQRRSHQPTIFD